MFFTAQLLEIIDYVIDNIRAIIFTMRFNQTLRVCRKPLINSIYVKLTTGSIVKRHYCNNNDLHIIKLYETTSHLRDKLREYENIGTIYDIRELKRMRDIYVGREPTHIYLYSAIPDKHRWVYNIVRGAIMATYIYCIILYPVYSVPYIFYRLASGIRYDAIDCLSVIFMGLIILIFLIHYIYLHYLGSNNDKNDTPYDYDEYCRLYGL